MLYAAETGAKGRHSGTNVEMPNVHRRECMSYIFSVTQTSPIRQVDSWRKPFTNAACDDRGDVGNLLLVFPHL